MGGAGDESNIDTHRQCTEPDSDDCDTDLVMFGYRRSVALSLLCGLGVITTCGLLALVLHWRKDWQLYLTHCRTSMSSATSVLIVEQYKSHTSRYVRRVKTRRVADTDCKLAGHSSDKLNHFYVPDVNENTFSAVNQFRYFRHKRVNYVWYDSVAEFVRVAPFFNNVPLSFIHEQTALSTELQTGRRAVFGDNYIDLHLTPLLKVALLEVLSPFYVFQMFSVVLWYFDEYEKYATAILLASLISVVTTVYQQRKNERNLRSTIQKCSTVEVWRENSCYQTILASELAPGDIIVVPTSRSTMPCDAILLNGNAIVNESMLTGESVPVTKVPLPNLPDQLYNSQQHGRHTLFSGTEVIQTRYYRHEKVLALVSRTGFMTAKGCLVRSILFPAPADIGLERDAYRFIGVLAGIAAVGMLYSSVTKWLRGRSTVQIVLDVLYLWLRGRSTVQIVLDVLDLVTIVVPPALPFAIAVGIVIGIERLRRRDIFCISPRALNLSGLLDFICFDKTGTLTEDGLDLRCVLATASESASGDDRGALVALECDRLNEERVHSQLITCMASCHSLMVIDSSLTGDPLDLKMFEATGWLLKEPTDDEAANYDILAPTIVRPPTATTKISPTTSLDSCHSTESVACSSTTDEGIGRDVGIIKQFVFDSTLQRMSVLTRLLGDKCLVLYCKGSPEKVASLCLPHTVPAALWPTLSDFTGRGYRVLALAYRTLEPRLTYIRAQRLSRECLESELCFLGLLVYENRLKTATSGVLDQLHAANIRTVMVTGDNLLTAVSVARECGIVGRSTPLYRCSSSGPAESARLQYTRLDWTGPDDKMADSWRLTMTGDEFDAICRECGVNGAVDTIVSRGAVFARMSPRRKQLLVEMIKDRGRFVAMCGDGANDCGALKAAHVGVSLSAAESSVAAAFTARCGDISCTLDLISQGRAALVTAFGIFKFMAGYSLAQFVSVMILYEIDCGLTDFQFLYIDLFLITVFAALFGLTGAREGTLSRNSPPTKLVSLPTVLSLVLQVIAFSAVQYSALWAVRQQPDFRPFQSNAEDDYRSHENFAVYTVSSFQYCVLAVAFSSGRPHRRRLHSNWPLSSALLFTSLFSAYLLLWPSVSVQEWFELDVPSSFWFRVGLLFLACFHGFLALIIEQVVNHARVVQTLRQLTKPREKGVQRSQSTKPLFSRHSLTNGASIQKLPLSPSSCNGMTSSVHCNTKFDCPVNDSRL